MAINYNPRIVTDGLVLFLDAGNVKSYPGSGSTWFDLTGNSNDGTLVNGPTYNSTDGGSIVFDGVNDYASCKNSSLNISDNLSVSLWIKFPTGYGNATWNSIFAKRRPGNQVNYGMNFNPTATNLFQFYYNNSGGSVSVPLTSNFSENVWTHICGTFSKNASTTDNVLYKNGISINSTNTSGNVAPMGTTGDSLHIGAYVIAGVEYCPMSLSFFQVYNRALSAAEIQQNFNATRGRFGI